MTPILLGLLMALPSFATDLSVKCDVKLFKVASAQLDATLPGKNWDVGVIRYNINNYGLEGRPRTVYVCDRASDSHQTCLIESFAKIEGTDADGCPNFLPSEVTTTCI